MPSRELMVVTGAAGFIGSHICDALLAHGYRVRAADNMSAGNPANLAQARRSPDFEFIEGDVSDRALCRRLCTGAAGVLHEAALSSVPGSVAEPERAHRDTATTTVSLLTAAREAGLKRFVFAASAACYSEAAPQPLSEDAPLWPLSPYAAAKIASEQYVKAFASMGLDGVNLRYFNVYGPRHPARSSYANVIPAFARRIIDGEAITIYGDGEQTRDFVHVQDVVAANLLALRSARPLGGVSVNIASGNRTSVNELVAKLGRLCGCEPKIDRKGERAGDFKHSVADTRRARDVLGFEASVGLEQGLSTVVQWMRQA